MRATPNQREPNASTASVLDRHHHGACGVGEHPSEPLAVRHKAEHNPGWVADAARRVRHSRSDMPFGLHEDLVRGCDCQIADGGSVSPAMSNWCHRHVQPRRHSNDESDLRLLRRGRAPVPRDFHQDQVALLGVADHIHGGVCEQ